jgi:hypothetical protein
MNITSHLKLMSIPGSSEKKNSHEQYFDRKNAQLEGSHQFPAVSKGLCPKQSNNKVERNLQPKQRGKLPMSVTQQTRRSTGS